MDSMTLHLKSSQESNDVVFYDANLNDGYTMIPSNNGKTARDILSQLASDNGAIHHGMYYEDKKDEIELDLMDSHLNEMDDYLNSFQDDMEILGLPILDSQPIVWTPVLSQKIEIDQDVQVVPDYLMNGQSNYDLYDYSNTVEVKNDPTFIGVEIEEYIKPPLSYTCLIAYALAVYNSNAAVDEIYAELMETFPYFETAKSSWKNSVRHNLSMNRCFVKAEYHRTAKRGYKWTFNPKKYSWLQRELKKKCIRNIKDVKTTIRSKEKADQLVKHGLLDPSIL